MCVSERLCELECVTLFGCVSVFECEDFRLLENACPGVLVHVDVRGSGCGRGLCSHKLADIIAIRFMFHP